MSNALLAPKALDGIAAIINAEVLVNLQSFINQVTALSKQSKKIQEIVNAVAAVMDEKTQETLADLGKRQQNEKIALNKRAEQNKLPKCTYVSKKGTECGKGCKSGHKKDDKDICDEHHAQLESYRDAPCAYTDCTEHVKKTAVAIDLEGEVEGVSYVDKYLCAKHHKKMTCALQKLNNPCKFIVQSKEGERMCGALAIGDERCKKHHGKEVKPKKGSKKTEEPKVDQPVESKEDEAPKTKAKKGSKKADQPDEAKEDEAPKPKAKKGSKKTEEPTEAKDEEALKPKAKKGSKKTEEPTEAKDEEALKPKAKKGSKKTDQPAEAKDEETPKPKAKKGSKKTDQPVDTKEAPKPADAKEEEDRTVTVNFVGKRPLRWVDTLDENKEVIYIDANSGLVASVTDDEQPDQKTVYAIWDIENTTIAALTPEAIKYAKKHKLPLETPKDDVDVDDQ